MLIQVSISLQKMARQPSVQFFLITKELQNGAPQTQGHIRVRRIFRKEIKYHELYFKQLHSQLLLNRGSFPRAPQ